MSTDRGRVDEAAAGERLDRWLAAHSQASSRRKAQQAITSGKVRVDGEVAWEPGLALHPGQEVVVAWSQPGTSRAHAKGRSRMTRAGVEVLHLDEQVVVVNKPAGLLTDTATRAQRRERDSLRKQLSARLQQPVWPAHRIDRDTTGIVAFARSEALADALRAQWAKRTPDRVYVAVLEGQLDNDSGTWADWMAWDPAARLQKPARQGDAHAVLAQAHYRVLARPKRATVVEVRLVSGRRNQIRVHAMLRGHPLVGERQYRRGPPPKGLGARRQLLHAWQLAFEHPLTAERLTIRCDPPGDLRGWWSPDTGA